MSNTLASLRHKVTGAGDLKSVVRSMKSLAAASIGQYERSVLALADYYRTVELGLAACLRNERVRFTDEHRASPATPRKAKVIVFGSDQRLVGQFNEVLAQFVATSLASVPGEKQIWAIGERGCRFRAPHVRQYSCEKACVARRCDGCLDQDIFLPVLPVSQRGMHLRAG